MPNKLSLPTDLPKDLRAELTRAGYFPELVASVLAVAVAGEPVAAHLVQVETTFDGDEVRRHLTVLVLTDTRLIAAHVDDHEGDEDNHASAAATTEAVPLREVRSVALTHLVSHPADYTNWDEGDSLTELNLAIGWGAVSRLELDPASCGDPTCDGDHGYSGQVLPDDLVVRVAAAAEGAHAARNAIEFARKLSAATAR